ncbi:MAG: TonB-dependent receptor [Candidatus Riflebacteria bacterium]|nr:TonB-dependent receptor [Candidatus Riflebacteria bacterium]
MRLHLHRFHLPLLVALLAAPFPCAAAGKAYDMGHVQVVGKDAQGEELAGDPARIELEMGEKSLPMPEILPEAPDRETRTLEEKPFVADQRPKKDEVSVFFGAGTRGATEFRAQGKGTYQGYSGELSLSREAKDGYRSTVEDTRTQLAGKVTTSGEGSYQLTVSGALGSDQFAQRGARSNPTPDAGIEDDSRAFTVKGNSTLSDGAFFTAYAQVDAATREITNPRANFSEEQELLSTSVGAEYRRSLKPRLTGRLGLDLQRDSVEFSTGSDQRFTKRTASLLGDFEMGEKTFLTAGFRDHTLMEESRFSPMIRLDHRWGKPWQFILSYEEDLGNDSLRRTYLPRRYVPYAPLRASHERRTSGTLNYRAANGNLLGAELFSVREDDAIEFLDAWDPGKGLLTSTFRFAANAKRTGLRLSGTFKLDENFSLTAAGTFQDPTDDATGRRLSYEAKRLLDVGLNYREGPLHVDFTRHAASDRVAYIPTARVDPGDYSRSDLVFRYDFKAHLRAYLKVRDLYDEAQSLRFNVPEEGRVTLAGLEANF